MQGGWAKTQELEFGAGTYHKTGRIYASKGDQVTCENGHVVCEFGRNVAAGEPFDPSALVNWIQKTPKRGQQTAPCEQCGARWYKGSLFHFSDGWRIWRW
jgi:hypothetical protein